MIAQILLGFCSAWVAFVVIVRVSAWAFTAYERWLMRRMVNRAITASTSVKGRVIR